MDCMRSGHFWPPHYRDDTIRHSDTPRQELEPADNLADLSKATQRWLQIARGEIPRDFGQEHKGVER